MNSNEFLPDGVFGPEQSTGLYEDEKLEHIAATLPDLIFIHDLRSRRNVYCNDRISELLGISREFFMHPGFHKDSRFFHPEDLPDALDWYEIGRAHV